MAEWEIVKWKSADIVGKQSASSVIKIELIVAVVEVVVVVLLAVE